MEKTNLYMSKDFISNPDSSDTENDDKPKMTESNVDQIEPFDFKFEPKFSSMNLEFTNSYRFEPSSSYMMDSTYQESTSTYLNSSTFDFNQATFESPSKYSKQKVGVVAPNPITQEHSSSDETRGILQKSKSNILSILNLLNQHVLSHPFTVFRRQAQVNNRTSSYHLTPFTVASYIVRAQANQGAGALFKGLSSSLITHVLLIGSETFFYNFLQLPIECSFIQSPHLETILKHLALKALSFAVVTPFICSSSLETVQSLIVSETSGPLDCLSEGLSRVFHFKNDRKFGFFQLIIPSVGYHLVYYVMFSVTREVILTYWLKPSKDEEEKNEETNIVRDLKSSLFANILTDMLLYPFQTVLFRVFLQGTRTLIDNVDEKTAVIPLISNYESSSDCYDSIVAHEGTAGLYKGFGALILQYGFQASLIELANYCIETFAAL